MFSPSLLRSIFGLGLGLGLMACAGAAAVPSNRCTEEDAAPSSSGRDSSSLETSSSDPRTQLQDLIGMTLQRSRAIGAARLLTQAAVSDLEETKRSRLPVVNASTSGTYIHNSLGDMPPVKGMQGMTTVTVSAPLFDWGHIARLTEWREQMAESARLGQVNGEEQLAYQTVSLALDRGRYVLQAQVYGQYMRKMSCLVDALQLVVKADKGRASELVQAQKSFQQADLSFQQTMSALRTTETRLRRLVGDQLPPTASMSSVLLKLPELEELQHDIVLAPDIAQADANVKAQRSYAESVRAGQLPSVNLMANASMQTGASRAKDWSGGVAINIPLVQPSANATLSAAQRRAQAAALQRDDSIEAKRYRLAEMYDSAAAALDRSRRIVEILRNSDRLRMSTLQQWQQLGRRSLFDVMGAEGDYFNMRVAHVNAIFDAQQVVALMWSMGRGVATPLR